MPAQPLAQHCAATILENFCDHQERFRQITQRASDLFNSRQWAQIRSDTTERLNLYAASVQRVEGDIRRILNMRVAETSLWAEARIDYAARIAGREDRELAQTFFNSVTRRILGTIGVNRRIEFVQNDCADSPQLSADPVHQAYALADGIAPAIDRLLKDFAELAWNRTGLKQSFPQVAARIEARLQNTQIHIPTANIEILRPVFYRGQGAYLIGRILAEGQVLPLVMALLHPPGGVVVDAVLMDADAASVVFSYTRSAFKVDVKRPGQLVAFLRSILPAKPEAEFYSAMGFFKHSKTLIYREVIRHTAQCTEELFSIAPGKPGMVMAVFDMAGFGMVAKVIRDRFDNPKKTTAEKVMQQYDFVFSHYRAGRLIEAHAFEGLDFDRCWFSEDLLDHLTAEAGQTVHIRGQRVIIDHAYLERRVTPLDIYLQEVSTDKAAAAVVDFGNAIKDLAFANIFAGDMLLKNFGVTRHGRVVFYDYDEIVPLTDCRFRKIPKARSYMEEIADEPWYTVDENDVFPEEFSRFLGLSAEYREQFLYSHTDLLEPAFWISVQKEIRSGALRHIRPYPPRYRLTPLQKPL
ncbi:isocitrate dehydrogenase kinase/phosphatase [Desulfosarcina widdelii]|uniref:Isocitrate dehydrogenase kinase/phosphatase n=1 Tax=Desulfosarcina widdelii TaxID=947919 RepID=A0A5K7Z4V6_9BACT|nr:bifunctional isocitrate dehydrogenase kinase/phosphatase [Desulfosarcina widdelii]BBO74641.1 isocitrate dehydrogenase kinase/phosphatase [Desulfosarcina widdelii]